MKRLAKNNDMVHRDKTVALSKTDETNKQKKKKKSADYQCEDKILHFSLVSFQLNSSQWRVSLMTTIVNAGSVQSPVSVPHSFQTLPIQPLPTPPSKPCFLLVLYALLHFSVQMRGEHNIDFTEFYFLLFNIDRLKY